MAKYTVLTESYINDRLVKEGDIIDYDGKAGSNLKLIRPEKKAKAMSTLSEVTGDSDNPSDSGSLTGSGDPGDEA